MLKIEATPLTLGFGCSFPDEDSKALVHRMQLEALQARSDALEPGTLEGFLYQTPVGDRFAFYQVTSVAPLAMRHVDFVDGASAPAVFRLSREDLLAAAQWRRDYVGLMSRARARAPAMAC